MLILRNCRVVPELTEGYDGSMCDIVIDGKNILDIVPCDQNKYIGENAEVCDINGMTVLPAFFDLHAHLMFSHQDYYALELKPNNDYMLDCIEHAAMYLRHGYTTIRDCGNDMYVGVAVRDGVRRGLFPGARVITAGKIISPTAKGNASFARLYWEVDDPSQMMHIVRKEANESVDFIKYMITGAVLNEGGVPGELVTTDQEVAAITRAAETLGMYVAAHCHGTEGIKMAVRNGIKTIEHASYMDEECIEMMLRRTDGVATVPTYAIAYTLFKEMYPGGVLPEFVTKARDACAHMAIGLRMSEEAGITVGWGTDLDMMLFDRYPGLEFLARKEFGTDEMTLLKEATINSAKIAGLDDVLGTVKAGKLADLTVIDGKPDQDISVMGTLPRFVFKEGRLVADNQPS